jgi:hypothetical protein
MALLAAAIFLATHRRARADEPIDVADHQVEHGGRGRI